MDSGSKLMSAAEAVRRFVHDGDCLALGGFSTNRRAYGLVREIIRQHKTGLCVESGAAGGDLDMLIGAGCVSAVNMSYIANSGFSMVCRRFREAAEKKTLAVEDYSLDAQTIAYHGAALGLSYVPVKNMLGSDLERVWGISEEERKKFPKLFFLIPGYGAQGASAQDISAAFDKNGLGGIVNSSRGIMCAYKKEGCDETDYAGAAYREAVRMRDEIMSYVGEIKLPKQRATRKKAE